VSTPFVVWLVVILVSTLAMAAAVIALVRHVMVLGRTLRRFQEEVSPIATEISSEGDRAASRAARMSAERPFGRS
jgi:hypothetical protein